MKEEDAPESEDHRECWCCGAPHHAAVSPPASVAIATRVGTTAGAFRRTAWTSLNTTRPVPSGCEILCSIRQMVTEAVGPVPLAGRRGGRGDQRLPAGSQAP